jgi:hypothetical protein
LATEALALRAGGAAVKLVDHRHRAGVACGPGQATLDEAKAKFRAGW